MKKSLICFLMLLISVFCLNAEIMPQKDIKEGMTGIGRTVFKGTEIETFKFKVLGFIRNFVPDKNLIIVELDTPVLNDGGILQGMSGSPLYIDGKIIGAVSYGFSFSKKPIAGVTPIKDIIETSKYNKRTFSIDISDIQIDFQKKSINSMAKKIEEKIVKCLTFSPVKSMSPIKLISSSRGITKDSLASLQPVFTDTSSLKLRKDFKTKKFSADDFRIAEADAVSVALIKGDFEYSASGTVSYVDGKKVYAFGHPFYNLGPVNFPMHKAEVISVVPSYQSGFKLAASKQMIGAVTQDRFSAIQGELGLKPYMIPVKIFLKNRNRTFNIELVDHPLLTPSLSAISVMNVLTSEYHGIGFQSLRVKGKIFIEGEKNVIIDDLYTGSSSYEEFSNLLLVVNYFLLNNKEKKIKIQKMDFEIFSTESVQKTQIENILVDKNRFRAGETINCKILFSNERGKSFSRDIRVQAPNLKPGSEFFLMVGDRKEMSKFDAKNVKSSFFPDKLNILIRAINNIRKNNRIYVKLITPVQGMFIKGHEFSNLPDSMKNVFMFNSSTNYESQIRYSTLYEYQLNVPAVVSGVKLFKFVIKAR